MAEAALKEVVELGRLTLRQKILAAMRDLEAVEQRGENKAQGYRYTMASDIILAARRALVEHGVIFSADEVTITDGEDSTTRSGAIMSSVRVTMRFMFLDSDSDETLSVQSTGEGQDTGDKAIYKAKTGALKYALTQNLMLASGDDAEDDRGEEERVTRAATPSSKPLRVVEDKKCPHCNKVGSLVRNRSTSMWQCWRSKGGCENVFTDEQLAVANGSVQPEDVSTPPAEEDTSERVTEKIVATDEMITPLLELISKSTDPAQTEAAILSRCGVKKLSDLTPKQVEWQVSTLQKKLEARESAKRPRK